VRSPVDTQQTKFGKLVNIARWSRGKGHGVTRLTGKAALVIGGGSGIGLAIAQRFTAEGARVLITGRRQADLDEALANIGPSARAMAADPTRRADLQAVVETMKRDDGRIDVLVVNAATSLSARIDDATEEDFDRQMDLNVRALFFAVQFALPLMGKGAAIVLIGSIGDQLGTEGYSIYNASKAAVRSLTRTWTAELAPRGIRVNVVSPGPTDTAMFASVSDDIRASLTTAIPMGRLGRPDEIASAALFLACDDSSFVTGAELCVDGGMAQV
jgi:NAD(P)-dependent dehydrogenase (short-subunit alcohol dehydrogenase family)